MFKHASLLARTVAGISLLCVAVAAHAQNAFFPNDATLDVSNPVVGGDAYIGYANFDDYLNGVNGTSPTVTMIDGGSADFDVLVFNGSTFRLQGGLIGASFGSLRPYDQSRVEMSGGTVGLDVDLQHQADFFLSGGLVGNDFTTHDSTSLNMVGGAIGHSLLLNDTSFATMSGGTVSSDIFVQGASTLTMRGNDLSKTLTDPNNQGGFYSLYTLTGHLGDGTDVTGRTVFVENGSGATFNVAPVPEPASLFAVGALSLGVLRRRRSKS